MFKGERQIRAIICEDCYYNAIEESYIRGRKEGQDIGYDIGFQDGKN